MAFIRRPRSAFTLIELLVVIAIIAILAVVVVLTLNPAQLLAQSRDANRISDMATLQSALNLYSTDQGGASSFSLGAASSTYISIADPNASSTCGSLGLPSFTAGAWACSTSSGYRTPTSTGWIPVNFNLISSGAPFGSLPVDPVNQTSSGLFYAYNTNGSQYEVTAVLESSKYKQQYGNNPSTNLFPEVISAGTPTVSALYNPSGLVGYWPLNEGSGSTAIDLSGNGNTGTWSGTPAGQGGTYYTGGHVGQYAGYFDGSTDVVNSPASSASLNITGPFSLALWMYVPVATTSYQGMVTKYTTCSGYGCGFDLGYYQGTAVFNIRSGASGYNSGASAGRAISAGQWHFVTAVFTGTQAIAYLDGISGTPQSWTSMPQSNTVPLQIGMRGGGQPFGGYVTDVRVYNRVLSPAEIVALYNAER